MEEVSITRSICRIPFSVQVTLLPFLSGDEVIPEQVYIIIQCASDNGSSSS